MEPKKTSQRGSSMSGVGMTLMLFMMIAVCAGVILLFALR